MFLQSPYRTVGLFNLVVMTMQCADALGVNLCVCIPAYHVNSPQAQSELMVSFASQMSGPIMLCDAAAGIAMQTQQHVANNPKASAAKHYRHHT